MIRSMTGFGEAEAATPAGRLRVELRTVNHRYLNVNARMPASLARHEPEIREWLRRFFARGHVNCTVRVEREGTAASAAGMRLDADRVAAYLALFQELRERFGVAGTPDLALLARFGDVFVRDEPDPEQAQVSGEELREAIERAAEATQVMRADEGKRLHADLENRLSAVEVALVEIERVSPQRMVSERDRLRAAVAELAGGLAIDEARLAQEVALLAERWDVNEELVRFRSHIELFRELMRGGGEEGVGKRLSFLVQEMHREANTIGSKANNAAIAHQVVSIKEEVERLREQVENVE